MDKPIERFDSDVAEIRRELDEADLSIVQEIDDAVQEVDNKLLSEDERERIIAECNEESSALQKIQEDIALLVKNDNIESSLIGGHPKDTAISSVDINPEEVYELYFKTGLTLLEVAKRFGFKSQTPIRRIFQEQGWESRHKWRILDSEQVYKLYFEDRLSLHETAKRMGVKSIYPIICIFEANGWKARNSKSHRVDIDPDDVHRLYFDEGLTMIEIAIRYGYATCGRISRIFKEQGWNPLRSDVVDDVDFDEVHRLYFDEKQPLAEVCRRLDKTVYTINKVFRIMNWEKRAQAYPTEAEREIGKKAAWKRHHEKLVNLRDEIFDTDCAICGEPRQIIHKKDGENHSPYLLWSIQGLKSLNPDEWAAVCKGCHLNVHALMRVKTFEWNEIVSILKNKTTDTNIS